MSLLTPLSRTPCPNCSCGFAENPTLFRELTSARVQQSLKGIRSHEAFRKFLTQEGLILRKDNDGSIMYPSGVCQSTRNKIRLKIKATGFPLPEFNQLHFDFEPGALEEDIGLPIGSQSPLDWKEADFLDGIKPWNGKIPESNRDA